MHQVVNKKYLKFMVTKIFSLVLNMNITQMRFLGKTPLHK